MKLAEKVAIITGAGSGMGRASAILFAKEGAKVVVADIDSQGGQETVETIRNNGGEAVFVQVNVTKANEVEKMISTAVEKFGQLNILYNNAGIPQQMKMMETVTEEEWDLIMNVNVKGIFLGCKYAVPVMKNLGQGVIINTASAAGVLPRPNQFTYSVSKGAVITLTKALAAEVGPFNIRVNCINPGPTLTPMMSKHVQGNPEILEGIKSVIPLRRMVMPEDIANTALYLASDEAAVVTGAQINVDSGLSINRKD